ncbi:unnamed protein product [Leptidea sinapis]|uniref:Regucalcin n=1 Tax=Leptidea sinapis TaxID=189913 RepID=A0A5E4R0X6_9NEOP|nr:unnamed protein product [Leptidea sinapis]
MGYVIKCSTLCLIGVILAHVSGGRPSTPFIKNVYRGGEHFEGPHWSVVESALYWVDISGQTLYRLDAASGNVTSREIAYGPVSLVVTVKDYPKLVLLSSRAELYFLSWDAEEGDSGLRLLTAVDIGKPDNRINDGKVDSQGRLWFGTMGKEADGNVDENQGTLYTLTKDNYINPEVKVRPVSVSNGIAWTSDDSYMFYIDSPTRNIDVFDYELDSGVIRNRRTLFSFKANNITGVPDGMTIDCEGNLWIACFNGGKQHKLPASKVTSVVWGGNDLSTLFVTTSRRDLNSVQLAQEPEAGSLFAIEGTGVKGLPSNQFAYPNADKY